MVYCEHEIVKSVSETASEVTTSDPESDFIIYQVDTCENSDKHCKCVKSVFS